MNSRSTLIMALILLAAGLAYGIGELAKQNREAKEYAEKKVFSIDGDQVSRVVFAKKKSIIQMEKQDEVWIMTSPEKHLVKSWDLTNLIYTLTTLKKEEDIKDADPKEFGLKPPALMITLSDGEKEETLLAGKRNYNGLSVYVMKDGSGEIFTVSSIGLNDTEGKISAFTEKRMIAGEVSDAKKLTICNNGKKTVIESNAPDEWKFTEPFKKNADPEKVRLYIQSASNVQGSDIEAGSEPENPDSKFKSYIKIETDSGKTYAVYAMEKTSKGVKCARLPLGESLIISNEAYGNFFEIKPEKFEDSRILKIKADTASKAEMTIDGKKTVFEKKAKGWEAGGKKVCEGPIQAFLWEAEILSYEEHTKESGKKDGDFAIYDENGNKTASFSVESKDGITIISAGGEKYTVKDDKIIRLAKTAISDIDGCCHNH